tara:strand:- start:1242 stop:1517 length:276 start_codon:yes stop_codon:yes gene_type:complete
MKNLKSSNCDLKNGFGKASFLSKHKKNNPQINMSLASIDIMRASEEEEFFYNDTGKPVPEGEPVGFDMDRGEDIELVLFSDIFWGSSEGGG